MTSSGCDSGIKNACVRNRIWWHR